jgi:MFS family permease
MARPSATQQPCPGASSGPRFFYGWAIVGVAMCTSFGQVAVFNTVLGIFQQPLEDEFGWSRGELAGAITAGSIVGGILSPVFGGIIDRYGARWVVTGPAVLLTFGFFALAQVSELWHFYVLIAVGRGLVISAIAAGSVVAVSNWFVRRRALAVAVGTLGQRAGTTLLPLLAAAVIAARGWPDAWRVLGVIFALVSIAPPLLLLRRRPEDMGLRPDGDPPIERSETTPGDTPPAEVEHDWTLRLAVRTRAYWLVGAAFSLVVFSNGALNYHQIPHLTDQDGISLTDAALVIAVASIFGAVGGLTAGAIATRWRPRWTLAGALSMQAAGVMILMNTTTVPVALVYAGWYGTAFGATVTLMQVIYADYFGRRQLGLIRGSFQPVAFGFNAAGPLVMGIWFDRAGSYTGPFSLGAACFIVAAVALALAAYPELPVNVATEVPAD